MPVNNTVSVLWMVSQVNVEICVSTKSALTGVECRAERTEAQDTSSQLVLDCDFSPDFLKILMNKWM